MAYYLYYSQHTTPLWFLYTRWKLVPCLKKLGKSAPPVPEVCATMPQDATRTHTNANNTTVPSEPSEPRETNGPSEPSGLCRRAPSVSSCRIFREIDRHSRLRATRNMWNLWKKHMKNTFSHVFTTTIFGREGCVQCALWTLVFMDEWICQKSFRKTFLRCVFELFNCIHVWQVRQVW